jgi:tRNA (adenine37-N6)-methyltransferase
MNSVNVSILGASQKPARSSYQAVKLLSDTGHTVFPLHLDGVDNTPLLDIKPYTAKLDRFETLRNGWQDEVDEETARRRGRGGYRNGAAS